MEHPQLSNRYLALSKKFFSSLLHLGMANTLHKVKETIRNDLYYIKNRKRLIGLSNKRFAQETLESLQYDIKFSILVPVYNTPIKFLTDMLDSVTTQTYTNWELCIADASDNEHTKVQLICAKYKAKFNSQVSYKRISNQGISENTNVCLKMSSGDYLVLLDHDDILHPSALFQLAKNIKRTNADFLYTDESKFIRSIKHSYSPNFKPCFSKDELRSHNYICHLTCFSKVLSDRVGLFRKECDGSQDHDMVLRLSEQAQRIEHIPQILYFWRVHDNSVSSNIAVKSYAVEAAYKAVNDQLERTEEKGTVESAPPFLSMYRVRYRIKGSPLVSVIICNVPHQRIPQIVADICARTAYQNYELIIPYKNIDEYNNFYAKFNASVPPQKNVIYSQYSNLNDLTEISNGDYITFVSDITPLTPHWIEEMLMFAQRKDVALVGCKILTEDNHIYDADLSVSNTGEIVHLYRGTEASNLGYEGRLRCARNVLLISNQCCMMSRYAFYDNRGFSDQFSTLYLLDYCFRARLRKKLIVWTPESVHVCHTPEAPTKNAEIRTLQQKWNQMMPFSDPYCPEQLINMIRNNI